VFTVNILHSTGYSKIYIGYSSNLPARLEAHNAEKGKGYTHSFRPWKVIHTEYFAARAEALKREKQLKSAKGGEFAWNLINAPPH
jgi:putative endonuclease